MRAAPAAAVCKSIGEAALPLVLLASGAGHDADIGMLFVRCGNGGISHDPLQTVTVADAGIAAQILRGHAVAHGRLSPWTTSVRPATDSSVKQKSATRNNQDPEIVRHMAFIKILTLLTPNLW
jgi:hypothetical protein